MQKDQQPSNQVQEIRVINEEFFTNEEIDSLQKRNKAYARLKKT